MDHVSFPYRAAAHLSVLHVIAESGSWEKHGVEVEYDRHISSTDSHKDVTGGAVDFVGGNHVSPYGHVARGSDWLYLGQTINTVNHRLCVRPDSKISGLPDLKETKIGTRGSHPELNDWLFLKQNGLDVDRDDIEIINQLNIPKGMMDAVDGQEGTNRMEKWQWVQSGDVDATLLTPPKSIQAAAAGMKIIDIEPLPMIHFTTLSTSRKFVEGHPELVERFLKGLLEGIAFFKREPEITKKIIKQRHTSEGQLDDEAVEIVYGELAAALEPKLYPTLAAIGNVYQEALRQDPEAQSINPLSVWDLHYIKKLDECGFVDALYE
ncbi:MAG: ABC transporter substrate-binding protein [Alphaproteobacteria bacterium]|nr:ABC transporter substrate-binding protein [Alphaproteobacteria bacterium]